MLLKKCSKYFVRAVYPTKSSIRYPKHVINVTQDANLNDTTAGRHGVELLKAGGAGHAGDAHSLGLLQHMGANHQQHIIHVVRAMLLVVFGNWGKTARTGSTQT